MPGMQMLILGPVSRHIFACCWWPAYDPQVRPTHCLLPAPFLIWKQQAVVPDKFRQLSEAPATQGKNLRFHRKLGGRLQVFLSEECVERKKCWCMCDVCKVFLCERECERSLKMTAACVEFILGALMNVGCAVATIFSDYFVLLMHRFRGQRHHRGKSKVRYHFNFL